MKQKSKDELRDEIRQLQEHLSKYKTRYDTDEVIKEKNEEIEKLNHRIQELESARKAQEDDADYIAWLQMNYKHMKRFLKESVEIETEVNYDYYGNPCTPYSMLEIREPWQIGKD